jgi:hypothetical protein
MRRTVSLLGLKRSARDLAHSTVFCGHPYGSRPGAGGGALVRIPNKIRLSQEQYFTVQGIYRGWALFGFVLLGAIGANLVHAILIRDEQRAFWLALMAFLLMVASFAIFFIWTYPANHHSPFLPDVTAIPATFSSTSRPFRSDSQRVLRAKSHRSKCYMRSRFFCVDRWTLQLRNRWFARLSAGGKWIRNRVRCRLSRWREVDSNHRFRATVSFDESERCSGSSRLALLFLRPIPFREQLGQKRTSSGHGTARHCQLKQRWYAPAVGGAVVRCGEVFGTPIGLSPSQPRGDRKLTSTPLS